MSWNAVYELVTHRAEERRQLTEAVTRPWWWRCHRPRFAGARPWRINAAVGATGRGTRVARRGRDRWHRTAHRHILCKAVSVAVADEFARDARVYAVVDHCAADTKSCWPRPGLCVRRRLTSKHKGEHALLGFDNCYSMIHKHCLCVKIL